MYLRHRYVMPFECNNIAIIADAYREGTNNCDDEYFKSRRITPNTRGPLKYTSIENGCSIFVTYLEKIAMTVLRRMTAILVISMGAGKC